MEPAPKYNNAKQKKGEGFKTFRNKVFEKKISAIEHPVLSYFRRYEILSRIVIKSLNLTNGEPCTEFTVREPLRVRSKERVGDNGVVKCKRERERELGVTR